MIKQLDLYSLCETNQYDKIAETLHMNHHYDENSSKHYLYYGETFTKTAIVFYKTNSYYTFGLQYSSGTLVDYGSITIDSTSLLNYSITNNGILFGLYSSGTTLDLKSGYFLGKNLSTNKNAFIGVTSANNNINVHYLEDKAIGSNGFGSATCFNSNYGCSLTPLIYEKNSITILVETAYLIGVGPLVPSEALNFKMNDKIYTRMTKPNTNTGAFWSLVIEDIE